MKANISALMDGELQDHELAASLAALSNREGEAYDTWCVYHLIGDAVCGTRPLSASFGARLARRLAEEPTVLAPAAAGARPAAPRRWIALSAAASVAAAVLVGWLALAPQHETARVQIAQAPALPAPVPAAAPVAKAPARVPLPREADDYLLAHQSYSLRGSLQGMMPYVRTVAVETIPGRP